MDAPIESMKEDSTFGMLGNAASSVVKMPPDERVSLSGVYHGIRYRRIGQSSNLRMLDIEGDDIWPKFVKAASIAEAETNTDGKYKFPEVKGGKYYFYAIHKTSFNLIEWLVPVEIRKDGEVSVDLYNKVAVEILNKKDD